MYHLEYDKLALEQIRSLKKDEKLLKKLSLILENISNDPYSPRYKFERLRHNLSGLCSKRLSKSHRVLYHVIDAKQVVVIVSVLGHYK